MERSHKLRDEGEKKSGETAFWKSEYKGEGKR